MLEEQNFIRQLIDASVAAGRKLQNPQTGLLHFNHQLPVEEVAVTIPLLENFLFVLALCRSRVGDHVQEAKQLLSQLLNFQLCDNSLFDGNFPLYLHEYPLCNDRTLGCSILPIFCRLLLEFHAVLGTSRVAELEAAAERLIVHGFRTHEEKALPLRAALQLAVASMVLGKRWKRQDFVEKGKVLQDTIIKEAPTFAWGSPEELGYLLTTLGILYPSLSDSPWKNFNGYVRQTYHPTLGCYAGPILQGHQSGAEPQPTLYDLFFSQYSEKLLTRAKETPLLLLNGALVYEMPGLIPEEGGNGTLDIEGYHTSFTKGFNHCVSVVSGGKEIKHPRWKGIQDFLFLWKDKECLHSFVGQRGGTLVVAQGNGSNQYVVTFVLAEGEEEVDFYLDKGQGCAIHVDDICANSFLLNEKVSFKSRSMEISVQFEQLEGEGGFRGHVMLGNRPCQLELKGQKRFNAYDWRIFLRRLHGKGSCTIKATITFEQVE